MIILNELKKMAAEDPEKYHLTFHPTNAQAILWDEALEDALYRDLGYDIDIPNKELQFPGLFHLRGRIGCPSFAVWIFEDGESLYVEFFSIVMMPTSVADVNAPFEYNEDGDIPRSGDSMGVWFVPGGVGWPYDLFHEFRKKLAREIDIDLTDMEGYGGLIIWEYIDQDDIFPLLMHSDCDGVLTPEECRRVGQRLRELVAKWDDTDCDKQKAYMLADGMDSAVKMNTSLNFL